MVEKIKGSMPSGSEGPEPHKIKRGKKDETFQAHLQKEKPAEGKMHKFGTMEMTTDQWHRFMNNYVQMIIQQIKQDQKRMQAANQKLKKSIEGQE